MFRSGPRPGERPCQAPFSLIQPQSFFEVRLGRGQIQQRLREAVARLSQVLPNRLSVVGLQVNWDVVDWGRKRKQFEEKRLTEEQAFLDSTDVQDQVVIEVRHHYRKLIEARTEVEVARASQSVAMELLRVTRNRHLQHEALLSDVLKVQSGLAEADNRFTQALLNLATAQADFERSLGMDP